MYCGHKNGSTKGWVRGLATGGLICRLPVWLVAWGCGIKMRAYKCSWVKCGVKVHSIKGREGLCLKSFQSKVSRVMGKVKGHSRERGCAQFLFIIDNNY